MRLQKLIRKSLSHAALAAVLFSLIGNEIQVFARRPAPAKPSGTVKTPPVPNSGWSGVITYKKTLHDNQTSDEKLFGRLDERERIKHNWTRSYDYTGTIVVNDMAGTGIAKTRSKMNFRDVHYHKAIQTEITRCHAFDPDRIVKAESTDRETTTANGDGEAYSYNFSVYGDTFRLGFQFKEFPAKFKRNTTSTYSNLCPESTRKPSASDNENETHTDKLGASIEGKVDPKNPDVIEGSKSWEDKFSTTQKGFTETVTWRLRRKPIPLMITNVSFYEPLYPSPSDWHEIEENDRAVDGNQIKVVATIANFGNTEKSTSVGFREVKENTALGEGPVSVTIPGNSEKQVEVIWDSSGYAWRQSGPDVVPEPGRQVEVKIPDDTMLKDLTVIPKPVLILPGFWQSVDGIKKFPDYFKAVSDKWNAWYARTDTRKVATDNAEQVDLDIRRVQKGENAWHVDLVTVQNGGLVGRVYVNSKMPTLFDGRPVATHLIMVGVPNLGTPCAEGLYGISFRMNTFSMDAVAELAPDAMKRFNLLVNNTNGTRFATLAVNFRTSTCQEDDMPGDGFVPVESAIWRAKTNAISTTRVFTRDIMGEVSNFRQIYKWLAIPPKGDHAPDPNTLASNISTRRLDAATAGTNGSTGVFQNAAFTSTSFDDSNRKPIFASAVKLKAKGTTETEISVPAGRRLAVNLFLSPDVSVSLLDEHGQVLGENRAGTPESMDIFRTLLVKQAFQGGKWKLRFENPGELESEAAVTIFVSDRPRESIALFETYRDFRPWGYY